MMRARDPSGRTHVGEFDFNLIRALDALLTYRNVTRAAESLGLGQSAMSDALRRLRLVFKDELLLRTGREYHLTPLAAELQQPVRGILTGIEETLNRKIEFHPEADERTFSIAASDYSAFFLLQRVAQHVVNTAPGISLVIEHIGRDSGSELENGELDILIAPCEPSARSCQETLFNDRWVCIIWDENPDVGESLTLEEYRQLPHLSHGVGDMELSRTTERLLDDLKIRRRVRVRAEAFFMAATLLPETNMVALVPERLAKHLVRTNAIRLLEPPFEAPPIEVCMSWSATKTLDPAHAWLRREIREVAATLEVQPRAGRM